MTSPPTLREALERVGAVCEQLAGSSDDAVIDCNAYSDAEMGSLSVRLVDLRAVLEAAARIEALGSPVRS